MTRDVVTCSRRDNVKQLMAEMTRRRIRHLPVVEDGALAGIVSIGDVVKNRLEEMETETNVLREAYIGRP
jgi:CBS domain-containing protein